MGDRAHPRRQGDLRELEERDETFPESPAYSAIQNDEPKVSQLKRSVLSLSASGVTERKLRDFRGAIGASSDKRRNRAGSTCPIGSKFSIE
jgi:hypothetical protein